MEEKIEIQKRTGRSGERGKHESGKRPKEIKERNIVGKERSLKIQKEEKHEE